MAKFNGVLEMCLRLMVARRGDGRLRCVGVFGSFGVFGWFVLFGVFVAFGAFDVFCCNGGLSSIISSSDDKDITSVGIGCMTTLFSLSLSFAKSFTFIICPAVHQK